MYLSEVIFEHAYMYVVLHEKFQKNEPCTYVSKLELQPHST